MTRTCIIPTCKMKDARHRIPQNSDIQQKWFSALKISKCFPGDAICTRHFKSTDYSGKRLRPGAVPSQLLSIPDEVRSQPAKCEIKSENQDLLLEHIQIDIKDEFHKHEVEEDIVSVQDNVKRPCSSTEIYIKEEPEINFVSVKEEPEETSILGI